MEKGRRGSEEGRWRREGGGVREGRCRSRGRKEGTKKAALASVSDPML